MPNISLANLVGIPGVNAAAMTQPNPNDCGAYAIIGAVGAFGVFPMAVPLAYQNAGPGVVNNNSAVAAPDNYHQLSAAAYIITGILNPPVGAVPVAPELNGAGNSYNSPAAMAQVAIDLGRNPPQINTQAAGYANLGALYPGARARCEGVVGVAHVSVTAGPYSRPTNDFTHIVCVDTGAGLHWVAQGTDGNFYDPGNGTLHNVWAPVNTGDAMGPYTFTGLWMVIK